MGIRLLMGGSEAPGRYIGGGIQVGSRRHATLLRRHRETAGPPEGGRILHDAELRIPNRPMRARLSSSLRDMSFLAAAS